MVEQPRDAVVPQVTSISRRVVRFLWRWTRRVLKTFALLFALILTVLAALQLTDPGRAFVLRTALEQTNQIIPGRIEAKKLGRLSVFGIELWDVEVFDPSDASVARVGHVSIETNVSGLLSGKIALNLVTVERADIDLRVLEERRGLIAAFSDPDAQPSPPSSSSPPIILVDQISLISVQARLPEQESVGQIDVMVQNLDARFALIGGEPELDLRELKAYAQRGEEQLLSIRADGWLPRGAKPARIKFEADSGPIELKLDAESVLPNQKDWERQALRASLSLTGVTAERIAHVMRDREMESLFLGEMALTLRAEGQANDLAVDGKLSTAGGDLSFDRLRARAEELEASLSSDGIDLAKVRADLPARRVAAKVVAKVKGLPPKPVAFNLSIRQARLDEQPLMDLDASGTWTGTRAEGLEVLARDGDSRIEASGDLIPGGEAKLAVRVDLRPDLVARLAGLVDQDVSGRITANTTVSMDAEGQLTAGGTARLDDLIRRGKKPEQELKVKRLGLTFSAQGKPPDLYGKLEAQVENASLGVQVLDQASLTVQGSASAADVKLKASGGEGHTLQGQTRAAEKRIDLELDVHVERQGSKTILTGSGEGKLLGDEVALELKETRITDQGAVSTEGIALKLAGQEVRVQGELNASGESRGLHLEFGPIDLMRVPQVQQINPQIIGTLSGKALVEGSTSIPRISLVAHLNGLGLNRRPLSDIELKVEFDALVGAATVAVEAKSPAGLQTEVNARAAFRGGPNFASSLADAAGDLELKVSKLETTFVNAYLPPGSLLFDAGLSSTIRLRGSAKKPELDAHTAIELRIDENEKVNFDHRISYESGKIETQLDVEDRLGEWIGFVAHVDLENAELGAADLGSALAQSASDAAWDARLDAKPRLLNQLALLSLFTNVRDLPPFSAGLDFSASHEPQQEPDATLQLTAKQTAEWNLGECPATGIVFDVLATHRGSANVIKLHGKQGSDELLDFSAEMPLALKPLLEQQSSELGALDVNLQTKRLKLGSLPFVCGQAKGDLTVAMSGNDLLGKKPLLSLDMDAKSLSLGSRETVDLTLDAQADSTSVKSRLKLAGQGTRKNSQASIAVDLPWLWTDGKVEVEKNSAFSARVFFKQFPIAPLLPPRGALSYARGTVDGDIQAKGRLESPLLHGKIRLNQLAFTSTALAQPLRGINGNITLDGRRVIVEDFEAHDRDGVLRVSGEVDLADMEKIRGKMNLEAKDFPLRQQGQVVAVTNLRALAEATVTPKETRATLTLHEVDTWLESVSLRSGIALDAHPDFSVNGSGVAEAEGVSDTRVGEASADESEGSVGEKPEETQQAREGDEKEPDEAAVVYITIDADGRFWIKRDDFAVKLQTSLETEVAGDAVRVNGDVTIDRGYLQLFGRVFDLTKESQLRFVGSNPPNPVLELEAVHVTRAGSTVTVRISGRANAPQLQFLIDGDEVDAGLAVQELFGGEKGGDKGDASSQAKSFVSGLTAGVLATAARRELGAAAPIVMIDPADKAGEGRLRAGFELDDIVPAFLRPLVTGAYLEGIVSRESEGESTASTQFGALLELYFPKNFYAAGQYGPGTTWSVDFGWQL